MARGPCIPGLLVGLTLLASAAAYGRARAEDIAKNDASAQAPLLFEEPPRREGTAVLSLVLDVPLLAPDATHRGFSAGLGGSFQLVGGGGKWPLMVGIGGGALTFDGYTQKGPTAGYIDGSGTLTLTGTRVQHSVQLRHAEVVLRFEPLWGIVRPFVEASLGFGVLWENARLEGATTTLAAHDKERDFCAVFGAVLGVDWRLVSAIGPRFSNDIVLTTALRRWDTSPMQRPEFVEGPESPHARTTRAHLGMWVPFLGVSLALDNRSNYRRRR